MPKRPTAKRTPARRPAAPKRKPKLTPVTPESALALLLDKTAPHSRRAKVARWSLRQKFHQALALDTLQEILKAPDRSMTQPMLDLAVRLVVEETRTLPPPPRADGLPIHPMADTPTGRILAAAMCPAGNVRFVPLEDYDRELTAFEARGRK
jgi:hypothetical protein